MKKECQAVRFLFSPHHSDDKITGGYRARYDGDTKRFGQAAVTRPGTGGGRPFVSEADSGEMDVTEAEQRGSKQAV